ncbi:hypothetical protein HGRIS_009487 [Hohenbuehelia grisea]|uniref:Uncharacterized protein n=1 Tax=Hohenbuehelia grisea TaxID=104357 RepID=A0ABR3J1B2_9AGAR
MRFSVTLLSIVAVLATGSEAGNAKCHGHRHSITRRCVSKDSAWKFREWFCTQEWQGGFGKKKYTAKEGSSVFTHGGEFKSQQECWDITSEILNSCLGHHDSGVSTGSKSQVTVEFCA